MNSISPFRLFFFLCFIFSSCFIRKDKNKYPQEESFQSIDIHQTPKEIAKDISKLTKKQQRAYDKQLRKVQKKITKRNKKKREGKYNK